MGDDRADLLIGLEGFVVVGVVVGAELEVTVETTAARVGCPSCGVVAALHDRREHVVRDMAIGDRPVVLVWRKRVWRCRDRLCERVTWSERSAQIRPKATLTERARRDICRRTGLLVPVAKLASEYGVSWDTAMRAVRDYGRPLIDDPARTAAVRALGVDETSFLLANRDHHTTYLTGFVDLERGYLLDIVAGRSGDDVAYWLAQQPRAWLSRIGEVALDPHRGYANGLLRYLADAVFVLDHFHAIKLANAMLDDVRRRVQNDTLGHRGRKHDPLFGIRRLLCQAADTLSDRQSVQLRARLDAGDNHRDEVRSAWFAKEALRAVYTTTDRTEASALLAEFYDEVNEWDVPEARRLARTIRAWEPELLNWHTTGGTSNGPTEAINLLIEKIRRLGHGYRNIDNYRLRLLLAAGGINWHTRPTARLRTHQPRLAA
jgi:transposase